MMKMTIRYLDKLIRNLNRKKIAYLLSFIVLAQLPVYAGEQNIANTSNLIASRSPDAQSKRKVRSKRPTKNRQSRTSSRNQSELQQALILARSKKYAAASVKFFQLSLSPKYYEQRMRIRYLLGLMLYDLKLYQLAAFQFISVIRDGNNKYVSASLEKLSLAANELDDETLLNFAISRVKTESFPAKHRDMLFYRIGEYQLHNNQYNEAIRSFDLVPPESSVYDKALYLKGLALAENNKPAEAVGVFNTLIDHKKSAPVTDNARVAALMGRARSLYQNKQWDESIQAYRDVPRDSEMWHDTIFESSWALLRAGKFRSALSNFQSLHSPYYEDNYLPESLLLRAIVYLYICQYNEMDKVLNLFSKIYRPVYKNLNTYLKSSSNASSYFSDVVYTLNAMQKGEDSKRKTILPKLVAQKISREGDFQRSYQYVKNLLNEKKRMLSLPGGWRSTSVGKYGLQTIDRRMQKARAKAGRQIRVHMVAIETELVDLFEQEGFIRYEMINGKKEQLKKRVAGKELPKTAIDEGNDRDYYIQNGYEYWPFSGEYWLDEIGNYHYLGTQSCE